jgi:hypothetical protein
VLIRVLWVPKRHSNPIADRVLPKRLIEGVPASALSAPSRLDAGEAIRIRPAPDASASTLPARAPAQVAVRTLIVRLMCTQLR